jgi:hypothetical protein
MCFCRLTLTTSAELRVRAVTTRAVRWFLVVRFGCALSELALYWFKKSI